MPREIENAIFRVIQESLTNVYRHSESQDARIDLTQETDTVTVRIRDFGKGFPDFRSGVSHPLGVGISGMRERVSQLNGDFGISRVEPGTLVRATLPLVESL